MKKCQENVKIGRKEFLGSCRKGQVAVTQLGVTSTELREMQYLLESKVIKTCAFETGLDWTKLCGKNMVLAEIQGSMLISFKQVYDVKILVNLTTSSIENVDY